MMVKLEQLVVLCLVLAGFSHCAQVRYDGYRAYDVIPTNEEQLKLLASLEAHSDSVIIPYGIDGINQPTNVVVAPHKLVDFEQSLSSNGLKYKVTSYNLQRSLNEIREKPRSYELTRDYDWNNYYPLSTCYDWLSAMEMKFGNSLTLSNIGKTVDGHNIMMAQIILPDANGQYNWSKPIAYIEAGMYGNEWISPATATFIMNELLTSQDEEVRTLARTYNWYILPHANPDGYEYSYTTDRLWRKNRSKFLPNCVGVDINRNFRANFEYTLHNMLPCTNDYSGLTPESENETQAITGHFAKIHKVDLYISLQGYSQKLLYPYGYSGSAPPNDRDLHTVADAAVKALKERYGTEYESGHMYSTLYPVTGSSMDWFYAYKGAQMAFTYKLRPSADSIFGTSRRVPATQIMPTAVETLDALIAMVKKIPTLEIQKFHM